MRNMNKLVLVPILLGFLSENMSLRSAVLHKPSMLIPAVSSERTSISEKEFNQLTSELASLYQDQLPAHVSFTLRSDWKNPEV